MPLTLTDVQRHIKDIYGSKDGSRGLEGTYMWFMEEVGELASSLRGCSKHDQPGEFADVLAWLATLANIAGIDLEAAYNEKYGSGCPGCHKTPCACAAEEKP